MQSKWNSIAETVFGTAVGFIISFFLNFLVLPIFGMHPDAHASFWITVIFTVSSLVRSYYVRRFCNRVHLGDLLVRWSQRGWHWLTGRAPVGMDP